MTMILELLGALVSSPLLLFSGIIGTVITYIFLIVLYRVTLHPLANYPGPLLAKFTDLYLGYHAWKGDRHLEFWKNHEKYGSVVRMGPNLLSFNTNTALKQIYGHKSNVRKADFYSAFPANKHTFNVHSAIDKTLHARKRRVISHAFADNAIKSMEKYIVANIDVACSLVAEDVRNGQHQQQQLYSSIATEKEQWSVSRNMANWADWLTFDIMGDLVFGKAFGMLEAPQNRFAVDLVSNAARRHLICGTSLFIHNWHLDKIFFRKIAAKREQYMKYSKAQAMERTKIGTEDSDRKDFFYYLLNARDPETGRGFSKDELWGESNLFIIAGSDTTSTALASTFFYLAHNQAALAAVIAEIRTAFTIPTEITQGPQLNNCHFLRACIDEAMRLSPPVAGALPRTVLAGGLTIDGHSLPADTDVCVPHYALHHNELYFPSPFTYEPSRWLPDRASPKLASLAEEARAAFAPFSIGPRGCIGKGMAYLELSITLARILFEYDMRLTPGSHAGEGGHHGDASSIVEYGRQRSGEYQLRDTFTSMKNGPMLQFKRKSVS